MNNYFKFEQERSRYLLEQTLVLSTVKGHLKGTIKYGESRDVVEFATMLLGIINEGLAVVEEKFSDKKELGAE
ncbi:hypothetical protein FJQ98_03055 [Lysinibacillus agricola]|uniref:Uncharacterized protein n=1 Tax=Lysinibacillus agricola TaxID=2590012 RepID=A0ABX7AW19_9BACI|nr:MULTISPECIES: hypothetical protein [Lysinibacillus]KOS61734.1 hypothetical protein AN161_16370 [Lysinibacillus sp. FJAT-14222]QQP13068.1 hypothetical protein FJQ98_03055 [Lysinibacillus agricola]